MTDDLVAFLRARLDEDAEVAEQVGGEAWIAPASISGPIIATDIEPKATVADLRDTGVGMWSRGLHIARHDPARVLAEVEAKRRIAREHGPSGKHTTVWDWPELGKWCGECGTEPCRELNACPICGRDDGCRTLRLLALPYAAHPDYREEWRP